MVSRFLILLIILTSVFSCKKNAPDHLNGTYKCDAGSLEISADAENPDQLTLDGIGIFYPFGWLTVTAIVDEEGQMNIPKQIFVHSGISGGGGCGNCTLGPFLVLIEGEGFKPGPNTLNLHLKISRKYESDSEFIETTNQELSLSK